MPPGAIDCPPTCAATVQIGGSLALAAEAGENAYLAGWEGECGGTFERCEFVVERPTSASAVFATGNPPGQGIAELMVTRAGDGTVTSEPGGTIDCGTLCETAFSGGGSVTLRANPGVGQTFAGWSGDCSGIGLCTIAVTERRDVSATFRQNDPPPGTSILTLTLRDPPSDNGLVCCGTVRVTTLAGTTVCAVATCTFAVPNGSTVALEPATGTLLAWDGGCVGTAMPCVLVLARPEAITARFKAGIASTILYGVNVTRAGAGRVASIPPGIDCGPTSRCQATFKSGVVVRLNATPSPGSVFDGWRGDCGGAGACTLRADVGRQAVAVFKLIRHRLAVSLAGKGEGVVSSSPEGITCPPDCAFDFPQATAVELRAAPKPGSRFAGWEEGCTGSAGCRFDVERPVTARARFAVCAASRFDRFSASAGARPRRVTLRLQLAAQAGVHVALLRGGKKVVQRAFGQRAAGSHVLRMRVPPSARGGRYRVQTRVSDLCGATKPLSLPIRMPPP